MKSKRMLGFLLGIAAATAHAQAKLVMDGSTTVGPIAKAFAGEVGDGMVG